MGLADRKAFPQIELRDQTPDKSWTHIEGGLTVRQYVEVELMKGVLSRTGGPANILDAVASAQSYASALIASWESK